jgi:hypothetical protein
VSFRLESLLAQNNVDSGDETTRSGLQVSQIRDVDREVAAWLEGVEYAIPCPSKKPGGFVTDRGQPFLVLFSESDVLVHLDIVIVRFFGSLGRRSHTETLTTWFHPDPEYLCGWGVTLWNSGVFTRFFAR